MSLQRCTSYTTVRSWFALAALALALGGCASGSGTPSPRKAASAIAEDPATREVSPQAQTLYEQAVAIMASGDNLEAQFRFEEFVLRYPDYPGAYTNLAIIHAQNGDDAGAEGRITDALMIDPRHAPTLNQLGMLLRRQGKFARRRPPISGRSRRIRVTCSPTTTSACCTSSICRSWTRPWFISKNINHLSAKTSRSNAGSPICGGALSGINVLQM